MGSIFSFIRRNATAGNFRALGYSAAEARAIARISERKHFNYGPATVDYFKRARARGMALQTAVKRAFLAAEGKRRRR